MNAIKHSSAKSSHYDKQAKYYDQFNEKNSEKINSVVETILRRHRIKSVLDLTCGTGSQVFWLAQHGFNVVGLDLNPKMLQIAKSKAKNNKIPITFIQGDMRQSQIGKFDAAITIFNAVGHLTKADFSKAMRNIAKNLNQGGYYLFDIFNLNYFTQGNNITQLTIDWQETIGNTKIREIQYSTIDKKGVLASYTISSTQRNLNTPIFSRHVQTLQIYNVKQLKEMLNRAGFNVAAQYHINGTKFEDSKTDRILIVARKKQ